jgi:hypothetical protein
MVMVVFAVVVAFSLLTACATTPEQENAYNNVREIWNTGTEQFLVDFKLAPEETKKVWATEVVPIMLDSEKALNIWGAAIDAGQGDGAQYRAWITIKNNLLLIANKYGKWFDDLSVYK